MATRLRKEAASFSVIVILLVGILAVAPHASAATITQNPSTELGTVDVANSATYTSTISVTGNSASVMYSVVSSNPDLNIDPSTGVITTTGTLPVSGSPYQMSGDVSDGGADTDGTWSFSLSVTGDTISQTSANTGSVDVNGSATYSKTLTVSGNNTTPVTFSVSSQTTPGLEINSSTGVITTTGTLPVSGSPYVISGTDSDSDGDSGSWSFSLSVTGDTISQTSANTGSVDVNGSATY
jgi:hypothetical protein